MGSISEYFSSLLIPYSRCLHRNFEFLKNPILLLFFPLKNGIFRAKYRLRNPALFLLSLFGIRRLFAIWEQKMYCVYARAYRACNARSPLLDGEIQHVTKNNTSSHARECWSMERKRVWSTERKRVDTEEYGRLRANTDDRAGSGTPLKRRKISTSETSPAGAATKIARKYKRMHHTRSPYQQQHVGCCSTSYM